MSAVIYQHPTAQRGIQSRPGADRASILNDVRRIAYLKGCNNAQRIILVQCAELWLDHGLSAREVLARARAKCGLLLTPCPDGAA